MKTILDMTPINPAEHSLQEIFDFTTRAIIAQGIPSVTEGRSCAYRLVADGRTVARCAAGWCIPDEFYARELEGLGVETAMLFCNLDDKKIEFLRALQEAHDAAAEEMTEWMDEWMDAPIEAGRPNFFYVWKASLGNVASDFKLDEAVLKEIPT